MNTRERFQNVMEFRPFDRLPIVEWAGWWDKTLERWHAEGLPASLTDRYDICRHFGLDVYVQSWFRMQGPGCPPPASHGAPILTSMAEYEALMPHLYPWPVVDCAYWNAIAEQQARGDVAVWFTLNGFFWGPRTLLGIENHLFAFYDKPDLMHRINNDIANHHLRILDALERICKPDFMTFAEDMSYNHGPMLSKDLFDEFMKPYYERVIPRIKAMGTIPVVDSDGDISVPAFWFREAGLEGILPLERQAGVDVAQLRRDHPRLRFIGCFDKMTMNRGEEAMRAEFERLLPVASSGGLVIACDHQTPPGVSYEQYKLYIRLFDEYAQEAGRRSQTLSQPAEKRSTP